jgi:biotin operon repressor
VFESPKRHHFGAHDPLDALILSTVAVANVAHLGSDPALSLRYGAIDQPEPFEIKRPISRNAVALSLGLSYETARRRIQKLIDAGALIDTEDGLVGANEVLNPEMVLAMAKQNATLLRRMVRLMREAGVEI